MFLPYLINLRPVFAAWQEQLARQDSEVRSCSATRQVEKIADSTRQVAFRQRLEVLT